MPGYCQYRYNPSELYQRTKPGMGPETICGAPTYPAIDEPELMPVSYSDGRIEHKPSGRMVAREVMDPYCPMHGGSPEPPPPPATLYELENAYENYLALAQRFAGAVTAPVPEPGQIAAQVYQTATGQLPAGSEVTNGQ